MLVADAGAVPASSSKEPHEPIQLLSAETQDVHRALISMIEELEAIDWYWQRAEACTDQELREILIHHRNEETEHALMLLEWVRRRAPVFDEQIRLRIGREGPIVLEMKTGDGTDGAAPSPSQEQGLGIGSLKGR